MKKMLHKIFSILLAACFILSAVPAPAAAAENTPADTTTNGYYEGNAWVEGGNGSTTVNIDGTNVTLSKTAAPVEGQENMFDITLKVQTSTTTTSSTPGGAVVLVIDASNSMLWSVTGASSRIAAAKAAARDFLLSYAGTDASAKRMLAIVSFNSGASTPLSWVNVAGGAGQPGYDDALAAINGLETQKGTNMEAGLNTAASLVGNSAVNGLTKSVVLLSDGAPTASNSGGWGGNEAHCNAAATAATSVKASATLYTVCFGAVRDTAYSGVTVGDFLRTRVASSNCAYDADDASQLSAAFKAIANDVTSGLSGEGWTATDPMADMISVTSGTGENFSGSDGTYTWKLSNAETVTEGNTTKYVYTYTYRVTLDVQGQNFEEGKYFPTNKPTYLNVGNQQYAFPVPGVKGVLPRTDISVTKKWEDNNNQDGMRTESVTVQLVEIMSDETMRNIGDPVVLDADNSWTHTWDGETYNLLVKSKGVVHEYQVVETEVPYGYTSTPGTADNDFTVTNTHEIIKTSVTVTKIWADNNDQDGIRPESIEVELLANGNSIGKTATLSGEGNEWTYTFEGLDMYANGQKIEYKVKELTKIDDYDSAYSDDGLIVTNTHVPELIDVSGTKTWADENDRDGNRPESITVTLMDGEKEIASQEVKPDADGNWTYTFMNVPKFREGDVGAEIKYTVKEAEVAGYEPTYDGMNIKNSHTPELTDVEFTKIWDDNSDQDGKRPKTITVQLMNGNELVATKTFEVTDSNTQTYKFENVYKYANGNLITYTVKEVNVDVNYDATESGLTITNTHTPEKTSVKVTKVWNDANNQDGKRPTNVSVQLYANGNAVGDPVEITGTGNEWTYEFKDLDKYANGQEITYTVAEQLDKDSVYEQTGFTGNAKDGFTITNSYTPELIDISGEKTWVDNDNAYNTRPESITITLKGGEEEQTLTVTAKDGWKWSFTGLPKYAKGQVGQEIDYTIVEKAVADYNTEYDGYNVINTLAPGKTSVTVTKDWEDDNNRDGLRPNDITVILLANGVETDHKLTLNLGNKWTDTFTDLDKYSGGKEIAYTIEEIKVEGYEKTEISGDATNGYTITNTHKPETVTISGTKTWEDNNDKNLSRPDSITVRLLANGTEVDSKTVTADNNWSYEFTGKPMNESGKPIAYTVSEDPVDDYSATYKGYDITNTYSPRTINIQVTKAWNDANDQDGKRPEKITVKLQADILDVEETLTLTADENWTGSFTNLVKYSDGKEVKYSIVEEKVEGYETVSITGDQSKGFTITNTHEPEVIEQIAGKKTWNDANNQDGKRPESITVKLLANGQVVDTQVVSEKESWIYNFENLPKFEAGEEIIYTVVENEVPGYSATYSKDNYNITNSYTPETINIKVSKSWVDSNDADGIRPTKVTIYLYANGEKTGDKLVLTKDEKWTGSFTDLPKYEDGKEIKYTIAEKDVKGYNVVIKGSAGNGFTVTNSHNSIPKTGDERTPILWIAMMLLAIIVVFFASRPFFYKKGKYSR